MSFFQSGYILGIVIGIALLMSFFQSGYIVGIFTGIAIGLLLGIMIDIINDKEDDD